MTTSDWSWNGARWWTFDFHTHTPASDDYGKGSEQASLRERTPREWLLDYMRAGIDCVAVTDHNSGAWVDRLKSELADLQAEKPEGFRPLVLFPGVEVSVNGGGHLLAILDPTKTTSDIDTLVGATGFQGTKGSSDGATTKSFVEVVNAIVNAGGIAVPAHVDDPSGLFEVQRGTTLEQALECNGLFAMEVIDPAAPKPQIYVDQELAWTEVLGSDAHHPPVGTGAKYPGSHFTWVKMGDPVLDGLRLALLDGELSVKRSDVQEGNPNTLAANNVIESISVHDAVYLGRRTPFTLSLNPWLNAIIGGRGTGKSTLLEFLRIAMRRKDEVPDALVDDLAKYSDLYQRRGDEGLLTVNSRFVVTYRKDETRFKIQWSQGGDVDPIQELIDGQWVRAEGDVAQRFPVRIYSQKQIFQLSKEPLALLRIVDEAAELKQHSSEDGWKEEEARFLSLRAKAREIEAGLADEPGLRGELADVTRKLGVYESTGHADVLKTFQLRRRQQRAVETWEIHWADSGDRLRQAADELVPALLDTSSLNTEVDADRALEERAEQARNDLEEIGQTLVELAAKADKVRLDWHADKGSSLWKKEVDLGLAAYEELKLKLKLKLTAEGAGDPSAYGELVQRRHTIQQRLENLTAQKQQVAVTRGQADESLGRLLEIRRALTQNRSAFIERVLHSNQYVRIEVLPYGAKETVEDELRRLLQREGNVSEKEIGTLDGDGIVGSICAAGPEARDIEVALTAVKENIRSIAAGRSDTSLEHGKYFADHLRKLPPEALDRLEVWFPEDSLKVEHSQGSRGRGFRPIQEGSPGEKTAALLAFLLSYGDEPLVLDQPEDDLDNRLIYDLIVKQLRDVKQRRQLIVVTHNANIVVNGDAELVIALEPRGGETQQACAASLQERKTRETICAIMEGGLDAFEQRYRRIALEGRHV